MTKEELESAIFNIKAEIATLEIQKEELEAAASSYSSNISNFETQVNTILGE